MISTCSRGEIYFADLSDGIGSEEKGIRPVIILQNDVGNKYSPTVIAAPLSTKISKKYLPTHVFIKKGCGIKKSSIILLEHIRALDKSRLDNKIGKLPERYIDEVNRKLLLSLGLSSSDSL